MTTTPTKMLAAELAWAEAWGRADAVKSRHREQAKVAEAWGKTKNRFGPAPRPANPFEAANRRNARLARRRELYASERAAP